MARIGLVEMLYSTMLLIWNMVWDGIDGSECEGTYFNITGRVIDVWGKILHRWQHLSCICSICGLEMPCLQSSILIPQ